MIVEDVAESAFRRHYAQIYRFVRRRSPSAEHAEDVTQAVFADAAAARGKLNTDRRLLAGWLHRVARRRLADEARKDLRSPKVVPLEAAHGAVAFDPFESPALGPALRKAIATLPQGQRDVVVLKLIEGRPFAEIAGRLHTTQAACKMRLVRGLEALRDELEKEGITP
ncbi:MAG TPA: sigma-70 family RNA polymerase sigma factor [Gaiellaceae bacterium]